MLLTSVREAKLRPTPTRRGRWSRARKGRRAVSDVVATILLLALTVTLFSAIFAFVSSFPSPPAQNSNQFQATLLTHYGSPCTAPSKTCAVGLNITHLAGPQVPGSALIYLKSAVYPGGCPFNAPIAVSAGIPKGSSVWNLGQVWSQNFTKFPGTGCANYTGDRLPDNITVYIINNGNLIFSVILPGATLLVPPTISAAFTNPGSSVQGKAFQILATVSGSLGTNKPAVNLAAVPGESASSQNMWFNATSSEWQFNVTAGNTTTTPPGVYTGFISVSTANGAATAAVSVTITSSLSSNGPLSVAVILVPSPPNSGTKETVQAVVTYTGSTQNAPLNVTFTNSSSPAQTSTWTSYGPSGLTISGPSTLTVVSKSTWTIPAPPSTLYTYTVSATAVVTGVGTVTGTVTFEPVLVTDSPASGLVGSSVTVTGSAFSSLAGSTVSFTVGGISATVTGCTSGTLSSGVIIPTGAGGFTCTITVPNGVPTGATTIVGFDAYSGQSDSAAYTVTTWTISPLSPTSGLVGSSVTVTGSGFGASTGVTILFDGIAPTLSSCTSPATFSGNTITDTSTGGFVCVFKIPNGATAGAGSLVASDTTYTGQVASAPFTVTAWTISPLSPTTGLMGSSVTVTGSGFGASTGVAILFDGVAPTISSCTAPATFSGNTITDTSSGGFVCVFTVPYGATAGAGSLVATDTTFTAQTASAPYTVTAWTISLNSTTMSHTKSGPIVVTGAGFAGGSTVSITYNGAVIAPSTCTTDGSFTSGQATWTTTAAGAFVCTFSLPTTGSVGVYQFSAIDFTSGQTASVLISRT